jgi:hypothetical protein
LRVLLGGGFCFGGCLGVALGNSLLFGFRFGVSLGQGLCLGCGFGVACRDQLITLRSEHVSLGGQFVALRYRLLFGLRFGVACCSQLAALCCQCVALGHSFHLGSCFGVSLGRSFGCRHRCRIARCDQFVTFGGQRIALRYQGIALGNAFAAVLWFQYPL